MGILYKKGHKKNSKKETKNEKKNSLRDFDELVNHRSDEYHLDRIPFIQTK